MLDEDGNKVKITTTTRTRKLAKARLSKRAVERRIMAEPSTAAATSTTADPPPPVTKRWADEEDEETEASSTATATEASSVNLDSLKIEDNDENPPKLLDDPDDSSIQKVTSGETPYTSAAKFEDLNLSPELLKGLYVEMKFQKPSKIQAISLPMILNPPHRDLIAQAHNGSGKTTCFVLGMLSRVDPKVQAPQALCVCPTRELANQNIEVLRKMGKYTGIASECAVPTDSNALSIAKRAPIMAQVVIGTPGTIKKWMSFKKLGASRLKILVFDEADQMLAEDGFKDDSLRIMKEIEKVNSNCQVLLFSATFNDTVKNFVSRTVKEDHNKLFVKKEELSLDAVKQYKVYCSDELAKIEVIKDYIFEIGENVGQTIIFVRTRNSAQMLHKSLVDMGYEVTSIQGALGHDEREKIVKEFRDGLTQVLISTDLLARGFDQQQVNLVINYDLPMKHTASYTREPEPDCEVYLHRVGRAGRFGRKGAVFNLICDQKDERLMSKIENHFGTRVAEVRAQSVEDYKGALKEAGLLQ
ncbi:DEAD-box ATP-dependent RNA helicase 38-like [Vigna radiata var. radiata]|uniref:RNA helicase n=1 Tax=Vigna radiata var. radiata TaxID=3916 RepID=A0A1S3V0D8_VIGRR|nr:DEAD-box ATP-dependent RNA helicase 38-like [Vigna radiata var. radiata]